MRCLSQFSFLKTANSQRLVHPNQSILNLIFRRSFSTTPSKSATVAPITAPGPPPSVPTASADHVDSRVLRRKRQAELLKRGQDMKAIVDGTSRGTAKHKRFWKNVYVKKVDEGYQIYLDSRPLRTPSKKVITIPAHKPHLASAIALEWDLLVSAQEALRQHLIPLTSLVSRALEIEEEDKGTSHNGDIRRNIVDTVMRYLDTDSLLCWAPEPNPDPPGYETHVGRTESLRSIQKRAAQDVISFLTERVWPGLEIVPVLDEGTIMPKSQPQMTRDVIQGWVNGLPAFELAGLERGVLAGKGLLGAARLLVEWSTELTHLREGVAESQKFGIEEAAIVANLETEFQTQMWGEVEDTHDVNKEDLKRQLGSVILLVSGENGK